jgi:hypothetical protein
VNLSNLVGQKLFLQFKLPLFLVGPGPAGPVPLSRRSNGQEMPANVAFLVARLVEADENSVKFEYETDAAPGTRVYVSCSPADIAFVSDVGAVLSLS